MQFLAIEAIQRPFDTSKDAADRALVSTNYELAVNRDGKNETVEKGLAQILSDSNVATLNVDMFLSSSAQIPIDEPVGPIITIVSTGGSLPERTHGQPVDGVTTDNHTVQIITRHVSRSIANKKAFEIHGLLDGTYNFKVEVTI